MAYQNVQPGFQAPMALPNPRNAKGQDMSSGERSWNRGICGCNESCSTFCLACWCPCISYGRIRARFKLLSNNTPNPNASCTPGDCCIYNLAAMCYLSPCIQCQSRGDIRNRYKIRGGQCGDCCTSCFCTPCDLTQQSLELGDEEVALSQGLAKA